MSEWEDELMFQMVAEKLPPPIREYRFHEKRRWRCDFIWLDEKLIVEVEGGIWSKGRHTRGLGFQNDCEKYNEAALNGYKVLRVTSQQIKNGQAMEWIKRGLTIN